MPYTLAEQERNRRIKAEENRRYYEALAKKQEEEEAKRKEEREKRRQEIDAIQSGKLITDPDAPEGSLFMGADKMWRNMATNSSAIKNRNDALENERISLVEEDKDFSERLDKTTQKTQKLREEQQKQDEKQVEERRGTARSWGMPSTAEVTLGDAESIRKTEKVETHYLSKDNTPDTNKLKNDIYSRYTKNGKLDNLTDFKYYVRNGKINDDNIYLFTDNSNLTKDQKETFKNIFEKEKGIAKKQLREKLVALKDRIEKSDDYSSLNKNANIHQINNALEILDAPDKSGNALTAVGNYFKGIGNHLTDSDLWSAGVTQLNRNRYTNNAAEQFDKNYKALKKQYKNLTDEEIGQRAFQNLSKKHQDALTTYYALMQAQDLREYDTSLGYQAGQTTADMIPFAISLAGGSALNGVLRALTKGISRGIRASARAINIASKGGKVLSNIDEIEALTKGALRGAKSGFKNGLPKILGGKGATSEITEAGTTFKGVNYGKNFGKDLKNSLADALTATVISPNSWANLEKEKADKHIAHEDFTLKDYAKVWSSNFVENATETMSATLFRPIKTAYNMALDKAFHIKPSYLLNNKNFSDIYHNKMYIGGTIEELMEEYLGAGWNTMNGYILGDEDLKKEWSNFMTKDSQAVLYASIVPSTMIVPVASGGLRMLHNHQNSKAYRKAKETLNDLFNNYGLNASNLTNVVEASISCGGFTDTGNNNYVQNVANALIGAVQTSYGQEEAQRVTAQVQDYIAKAHSLNGTLRSFSQDVMNMPAEERENLCKELADVQERVAYNNVIYNHIKHGRYLTLPDANGQEENYLAQAFTIDENGNLVQLGVVTDRFTNDKGEDAFRIRDAFGSEFDMTLNELNRAVEHTSLENNPIVFTRVSDALDYLEGQTEQGSREANELQTRRLLNNIGVSVNANGERVVVSATLKDADGNVANAFLSNINEQSNSAIAYYIDNDGNIRSRQVSLDEIETIEEKTIEQAIDETNKIFTAYNMGVEQYQEQYQRANNLNQTLDDTLPPSHTEQTQQPTDQTTNEQETTDDEQETTQDNGVELQEGVDYNINAIEYLQEGDLITITDPNEYDELRDVEGVEGKVVYTDENGVVVEYAENGVVVRQVAIKRDYYGITFTYNGHTENNVSVATEQNVTEGETSATEDTNGNNNQVSETENNSVTAEQQNEQQTNEPQQTTEQQETETTQEETAEQQPTEQPKQEQEVAEETQSKPTQQTEQEKVTEEKQPTETAQDEQTKEKEKQETENKDVVEKQVEQKETKTEESNKETNDETNNTQETEQEKETIEETTAQQKDETANETQEKQYVISDERYEELKKRMREKLNQLNIGLDPELFSIGVQLAFYHIERGARKFKDYAKNMINDFGDKMRPYLKSFYNGARDLPEAVQSGISDEMTPYEEVRNIDVNTLGKENTEEKPQAEQSQPKPKSNAEKLNEKLKEAKEKKEKSKATDEKETKQETSPRTTETYDNTQQKETTDTPIETERARETESTTENKTKKNVNNFHNDGITENETSVSATERMKRNISAIKLAKQILAEDRKATKDEQQILAKYTGWGGLGSVFNDENKANKLKEVLTEEEYESAKDSTDSAYYTPKEVINTLWSVVKQLGFKGGKILESSAGIGNILSLIPQEINSNSSIRAVELDSISGSILKLLYPDAKVEIQGFQDTDVPPASVDLAITNVPFIPGLSVYDKKNTDLSNKFKEIHNFFIAKNVRALKEGGIGIFITTKSTLDRTPKLVEWITSDKGGNADIIGAFRLNNETFAGTGATSDIIVIRKRTNGKISENAIDVRASVNVRGVDIVDNGTTKRFPLNYNMYYVQHPENMGGEMEMNAERGSTFRPTGTSLVAKANINQNERLETWVESFSKHEKVEIEQDEEVKEYEDTTVKDGAILINSEGKVCISYQGKAVPITANAKTDNNKIAGKYTKKECIEDYHKISGALNEVLECQEKEDKELKKAQKKLNDAYDNFVNKYGPLSYNPRITFLKRDVDFPSLMALEDAKETLIIDKKTGKEKRGYSIKKSTIFSERVLNSTERKKPETVKDAVIMSQLTNGFIDIEQISKELNFSQDEIIKEITKQGIGFINPETKKVEISYIYLSGNVRKKLEIAKANNTDGEYDYNISALKKVLPQTIPASFIDVQIGNTFVSPEVYYSFLQQKYGIKDGFFIKYTNGRWITNQNKYRRISSIEKERGVYNEKDGNALISVLDMFFALLNNRSLTASYTITDEHGKKIRVTDMETTAVISTRMDEIKDEFREWIKEEIEKNPKVAKELEEKYNEQCNSEVPINIGDEFLPEQFIGQNPKIKLHPHQKRAVMRSLLSPTMLAHEVGTGKTFTMIATAMEMRRLGLAKKPMIVVQNATLNQFVAQVKTLYPKAKVLSANDKDKTKDGRKYFASKVRNNDWDIIVIPQSMFNALPDNEEQRQAYIQETIQDKIHTYEILEDDAENQKIKNGGVDRNLQITLSILKKEVEALQKKLDEKTDDEKIKSKHSKAIENVENIAKGKITRKVDDDNLTLTSMGIDALFIDEAHEYKKLGFSSLINRGIKGIDKTSSKRAVALYLKTREIFAKVGQRNVIFATGTPISNTAAEIWTWMKFLLPKEDLENAGIWYFDDFVRNYGKINMILAFSTSGKFQEQTRFSGYTGLPELIRLWSSFADVVLKKEEKSVNANEPELENGKEQDIFLEQTPYFEAIMNKIIETLEEYEEMTGADKKENSYIPLTMFTLAKQAAIDPRLVLEDATLDQQGTKTNEAVKITLELLEQSKAYRGSIAIFSDSYYNKTSGFSVFADIKDKLINNGVNENEIFIMRSGLTDKKKAEIFDKVNKGEIRVILGTTALLGVGVNIQERLFAEIHLDAPLRPMDYMQRVGRIIRQGNAHKQMDIPVKIIRFGVKNSLDVSVYQLLSIKERLIQSIMNGKGMLNDPLAERELEEEEVETSFDNPVAQLSGSENALLYNKAKREYNKIKNKKEYFDKIQIKAQNELPQDKIKLKASQETLAKQTARVDEVKKYFANGVTSIEIKGEKFTSVDNAKKFISETITKGITKKTNELREDSTKSKVTISYSNIKINGVQFSIKLVLDKTMDLSTRKMTVSSTYSFSCETLNYVDYPIKKHYFSEVLSEIIKNVSVDEAEKNVKVAQDEIDTIKADIKSKEETISKKNEFVEQLEKAYTKMVVLGNAMQEELIRKDRERELRRLGQKLQISDNEFGKMMRTAVENGEEAEKENSEVDNSTVVEYRVGGIDYDSLSPEEQILQDIADYESGLLSDEYIQNIGGAIGVAYKKGQSTREYISQLKQKAETEVTEQERSDDALLLSLIDVMQSSNSKLEVITDEQWANEIIDRENGRGNIQERRVYHGSDAEFTEFDHSKMSTGEGNQVHGWGTYVAVDRGTSKAYAECLGKYFCKCKGLRFNSPHSLTECIVNMLYYPLRRNNSDELTPELENAKHIIWNYLEKIIINSRSKENLLEVILNTFPTDSGISREYLYDILKGLGLDKVEYGKRQGFLYIVEIPNRTKNKYLEEDKVNKELNQKIIDAFVKGYVFIENELEQLVNKTNRWKEYTGGALYETLSEEFGNAELASKFLNIIGIVGIHYNGRLDGECFVIFNEKDLQIKNKEKIQFFKTSKGECYGFTVGGKIYIDTRIAKADTPIHEFTHLWARALRENNPDEWKNIVALMKKQTHLWEYVKNLYPELTDEDAIADEVLAHFSGKRGLERLEAEQKRLREDKSMNLFAKARALQAIKNVKQALERFWKDVADFLHIHFTTAEEVADKVLADLLNGVNPNEFIKDEYNDIQLQKVQDKATIERLEGEKKVKVYRAMQMQDGKLYPPMSAKERNGVKETTNTTENSIEMHHNERAEKFSNLNKQAIALEKEVADELHNAQQNVVDRLIKNINIEVVSLSGEELLKEAIKYSSQIDEVLKTQDGNIYGFTVGGKIFLNKEIADTNTKMHELTHLWDASCRKNNPTLWKRGVELMKQTALWKEIRESGLYDNLTDDELASEVHARLTGEEAEQIFGQMNETARENGSNAQILNRLTVIQKLKNWIKDFWYWVKDTQIDWRDKDASKVSLRDFINMPIVDLVKGTELDGDFSTIQFKIDPKGRVETPKETMRIAYNLQMGYHWDKNKHEWVQNKNSLLTWIDRVFDRFSAVRRMVTIAKLDSREIKANPYYELIQADNVISGKEEVFAMEHATRINAVIDKIIKATGWSRDEVMHLLIAKAMPGRTAKMIADKYKELKNRTLTLLGAVSISGDDLTFVQQFDILLSDITTDDVDKKLSELGIDIDRIFVGKNDKVQQQKADFIQSVRLLIAGEKYRDTYSYSTTSINTADGYRGKDDTEGQVQGWNGEHDLYKSPLYKRFFGKDERTLHTPQEIMEKAKAEIGDELYDALTNEIKSAVDEVKKSAFIYNLVTKKTLQRFLLSDKYWLPLRGWDENLYRIFGEDTARQRVLEKAKGRNTIADNPLQYLYSMYSTTIRQGVYNNAKKTLIDFLFKHGDLLIENGKTASAKKYKWRPNNREEYKDLIDESKKYLPDDEQDEGYVITSIPPDLSEVALDSNGQVNIIAGILSNDELDEQNLLFFDTLNIFDGTYDRAYTKGIKGLNKYIFTYKDARGIEYKVAINDKKLVKILNTPNLSSPLFSKGGYLIFARITRLMSSLMTSKNLGFMIRNLERDYQTAMFTEVPGMDNYRKHYNKHIHEDLKMLAKIILTPNETQRKLQEDKLTDEQRHTYEMYKQWLESGGATGMVYNFGTVARALESYAKTAKGDIFFNLVKMPNEKTDKVMGVLKNIASLKYIELLSEVGENLIRFASYRAFLDEGMNEKEASYQSRESTVNFTRWGVGGKFLNGFYPFFSATINALYRNGRLIVHNPKGFALQTAIYIGVGLMQGMFMAMIGSGDGDGDDKKNSILRYILGAVSGGVVGGAVGGLLGGKKGIYVGAIGSAIASAVRVAMGTNSPYENVSDYLKLRNFYLPIGNLSNVYVSVPQEQVPAYALGLLTTQVALGLKTPVKATYEMMQTLVALFPESSANIVNGFMEYNGAEDKIKGTTAKERREIAYSLLPNVIQVFTDLDRNKNFMGYNIILPDSKNEDYHKTRASRTRGEYRTYGWSRALATAYNKLMNSSLQGVSKDEYQRLIESKNGTIISGEKLITVAPEDIQYIFSGLLPMYSNMLTSTEDFVKSRKAVSLSNLPIISNAIASRENYEKDFWQANAVGEQLEARYKSVKKNINSYSEKDLKQLQKDEYYKMFVAYDNQRANVLKERKKIKEQIDKIQKSEVLPRRQRDELIEKKYDKINHLWDSWIKEYHIKSLEYITKK